MANRNSIATVRDDGAPGADEDSPSWGDEAVRRRPEFQRLLRPCRSNPAWPLDHFWGSWGPGRSGVVGQGSGGSVLELPVLVRAARAVPQLDFRSVRGLLAVRVQAEPRLRRGDRAAAPSPCPAARRPLAAASRRREATVPSATQHLSCRRAVIPSRSPTRERCGSRRSDGDPRGWTRAMDSSQPAVVRTGPPVWTARR
jgi:hypothetical protein